MAGRKAPARLIPEAAFSLESTTAAHGNQSFLKACFYVISNNDFYGA